MPNTQKGSGVSRKITNKKDREKLKKIVTELHIDSGSTVIRTAGVGHTKTEIKKDFAFLTNIWNEIRETTLKSSAPCLIHEEAGIIKRSLRDLYSKEIDFVVVEGEKGYRTAKEFMKKLIPSHSRKVKLYNDKNIPLFSKYKLNEQISQIYSTRVDLPSGGYLIINNTEALISIDVNSGKSTRERNIAGTALKTNMEAAQEIARQCRLRDLAGLIVVDFIDMEEKRNNIQVERCMRESLKSDKAKIQVGTISNFGLLEFSRQRLRSSIVDANMIVCPHCRGTGFMWTEESLAVQILRKIEEACIECEFKEIIVTLSNNIALYILNNKRSFISAIESRGNLKITFNIDYHIAANDFSIDQVLKPTSVISEDEDDSKLESEQDISEKMIEKQQLPRNRLKTSEKTFFTNEKSDSKIHSPIKKKFKIISNNDGTVVDTVRDIEGIEKTVEPSSSRKVTRRSNIKKNSQEKIAGKSSQKPKRDSKKIKMEKGEDSTTNLKSDKNKATEIPELKEGKVDFNAKIEVSKYQRDMVSKVMQSYQDEEFRNTEIAPVANKKKRNGWWQKLLKKPGSN
ncbi:MAG: Rne/Rng family ribonuclease, partial [Alphaproteobacteria bacterium]|nr:Rne/Rng family ribonuclease [Alphaproteobacteria bacterium]